MTRPKNAEWVSGLRDLADWLERNPEVSIDSRIGNVKPFQACREATVNEARTFAAQHGFTHLTDYPDEIDGVVREVAYSRSFGPLTVAVWGEDSVSEEWLEQHRVRKQTFAKRIKAVFS